MQIAFAAISWFALCLKMNWFWLIYVHRCRTEAQRHTIRPDGHLRMKYLFYFIMHNFLCVHPRNNGAKKCHIKFDLVQTKLSYNETCL